MAGCPRAVIVRLVGLISHRSANAGVSEAGKCTADAIGFRRKDPEQSKKTMRMKVHSVQSGHVLTRL
jgi:hypothetical protein